MKCAVARAAASKSKWRPCLTRRRRASAHRSIIEIALTDGVSAINSTSGNARSARVGGLGPGAGVTGTDWKRSIAERLQPISPVARCLCLSPGLSAGVSGVRCGGVLSPTPATNQRAKGQHHDPSPCLHHRSDLLHGLGGHPAPAHPPAGDTRQPVQAVQAVAGAAGTEARVSLPYTCTFRLADYSRAHMGEG